MSRSNTVQYLNPPPRLLTEKEREMEKEAAKGEWVGKEGVVPDRSCESNYVLGNVIICDE